MLHTLYDRAAAEERIWFGTPDLRMRCSIIKTQGGKGVLTASLSTEVCLSCWDLSVAWSVAVRVPACLPICMPTCLPSYLPAYVPFFVRVHVDMQDVELTLTSLVLSRFATRGTRRSRGGGMTVRKSEREMGTK